MMHRAIKMWRDPTMKTAIINGAQNPYNQYQNAIKPGMEDGKTTESIYSDPVDKYTPSVKGAADPAAIDRLWKDTNYAANAVRKLVASMLGKTDATGQGFWATRAGGGYKLSEADRAKAQQMIGEDGFFGVKQTTARIMDFAMALVGKDASPEKIESMRAAVQKGFKEVGGMFGGFDNLPDVTKSTYDSVMRAFDNWRNGVAAE